MLTLGEGSQGKVPRRFPAHHVIVVVVDFSNFGLTEKS